MNADSPSRSVPFCPIPWAAVCAQPFGVTLCCVSSDDLRERSDQSPWEAFRSPRLQEIRQTFLRGEWPRECRACAHHEQSGIRSHRERELIAPEYTEVLADRARLTTEHRPLSYLELAFDNTCNLKCRMCSPQYSSRWNEDVPALALAGLEDCAGPKAAEKPIQNLDPEALLDQLGPDPTLSFKGGEPMLNRDFEPIIKGLVKRGRAKNTTLRICTNGTVVSRWFLELMNEFKRIDMAVSVDGVDPLFRYIRHGRFSMKDVKGNVEKVLASGSSVTVTITTSYQIYNMLSYDRLVREFLPLTPYFVQTLVLNKALSVQMAPRALRDVAIQRIEELASERVYAESTQWTFSYLLDILRKGRFDPDSWKLFEKYTRTLDAIRDEAIEAAEPALIPYLAREWTS